MVERSKVVGLVMRRWREESGEVGGGFYKTVVGIMARARTSYSFNLVL